MIELEGKPIQGTVSHYTRSRHVEQHEPIKLVELLDALLELQEVDSVRWEQYTPYFNDGDPCYFSVGEARVKFVKVEEVDGDEDDYDDEGDWGDGYLGDYEIDEISFKEVYERLRAVNKEIDHHEVILQDKFGDPAQVTYDGQFFTVEGYHHD